MTRDFSTASMTALISCDATRRRDARTTKQSAKVQILIGQCCANEAHTHSSIITPWA